MSAPTSFRIVLTLAVALVASMTPGCQPTGATLRPPPGPGGATVGPPADHPHFTNVTKERGIRFAHNAAAAGHYYFVETMGAGVAFLDYDGDGKQDLLYLNGGPLPGFKATAPMLPGLYRNLGAGKFRETTREAGLALQMYGMGIAVGDYDHDGDDDLYLTAVLGPSFLLRNEGGRFVDVSREAGVNRPGSFPTSAAWLDYDKDGDLDLYVCNYVRYRTTADDLPCSFKDGIRSYCIPSAYAAEKDCLYRNEGDGTFTNVATEAGVAGADGKSLGVAVWDLNQDTWPDLIIANDTTPTHVYINQKNGKFRERAAMLGLAYGVTGIAKAGMGVDIADDRNNGLPTAVMSNFSGEMLGLYRDGGNGLFREESLESGVGAASARLLGFGVFFFDYNNDGLQDLFVANGHVQDRIAEFSEGVHYRQPPLLLRNVGSGKYEDITALAGAAMTTPLVGRGAAWGDIDDDGRLDVAVNNNQGPAVLLRNETTSEHHWLKVRLVGRRSNGNGFGARVTARTESGTQLREARGGSSYCSQSDQRLHFGLGRETRVAELKVRWPSGTVDTLRNLAADRLVRITEGAYP